MAFENIISPRSFDAGESLAAKQYTFVKLNSSGDIVTPSAGGYAIGVVQDKPASGQPGAVCSPGDITKILCGGAFAAGDDLTTDGNGKAVAATTGDYVLGQAIESGSSGKVSTMRYQPKASVVA